MYVWLYFHGFMLCSCLPLLFIILIVISHWFICDYVYFFSLIVNLLLILGFILIMCVYLQLSSFCLFFFLSAVLFYLYTVLDYVWVMDALFNCFVLCLLHLLLPLPPCFLMMVVFFCCFIRRHFVIFSSICCYDCYSYNRSYHRRFWPSSYYS